MEQQTKISDGKWIWVSKRMINERGWYPNWVGYQGDQAIIRVNRSMRYGTFLLSTTAFYDLLAAVQTGEVKQGFIELIERDGTRVAQETVQFVQRSLADIEPASLPEVYGERWFWFLNDAFQPTGTRQTDAQCPM